MNAGIMNLIKPLFASQESQVGEARTDTKIYKGEDSLLRELKEAKGLAWQAIHRWFTAVVPGRSVGALQVHY